MAGQGLSWLCLSTQPPSSHERMGGWKEEERQMSDQEETHPFSYCQLFLLTYNRKITDMQFFF